MSVPFPTPLNFGTLYLLLPLFRFSESSKLLDYCSSFFIPLSLTLFYVDNFKPSVRDRGLRHFFFFKVILSVHVTRITVLTRHDTSCYHPRAYPSPCHDIFQRSDIMTTQWAHIMAHPDIIPAATHHDTSHNNPSIHTT